MRRSPRRRRGAAGVVIAGCAAAACSRADEPAPPAAEAPRPPSVSVSIGEPIDGFERSLRLAAREQAFELAIEAAHGHAAAQIEQVSRLLQPPPAVLVLGPVVPDVLQRARAAAAEKGVPTIALLRGDGRGGSWVGVASATLARAAGERAGGWLRSNGRSARPRVVVVEDSRWPETTRRVEETLRGIEATCGEIDLPLRLRSALTPAETARSLVEALGRMGGADVLVAGDRVATEGAVQGAAQSSLSGSLLVVGTTDDPKLVEAAADAGSRLVLVAWKRDDVAAQLLDAVAATIADPAAAVRRDVPCELVGAGVTSPPKDGS